MEVGKSDGAFGLRCGLGWWKDLRVLVTGGAGYLGSVLSRRLLEKGHFVRVLDNFMFGTHMLPENHGATPNLELVEADIRNMVPLVNSMRDVDAVIHLASIVGDAAGDLDPKTTVEVNYLATRNIAELCGLYGKRLLFPSTCSVYGERDESLMTEDSKMVEPVSLYGTTKLRSEKGIRECLENFTIFRLGTLFGHSPRMRFDLAINLMAAKALSGEEIEVYGGSQWRPFIHVRDAAEAFVHGLENNLAGTFNVSWKNFRMQEVADLIGAQMSAPTRTVKKIVDRRSYRVDTSRILATGFSPSRDVGTAIAEITAAFKAGGIGSYREPRYSNFKSLFESEETRRKLFTAGPIFNASAAE